MDGEQRTVNDRLIKFEARTQEEISDEQEKRDLAFFDSVEIVKKIQGK